MPPIVRAEQPNLTATKAPATTSGEDQLLSPLHQLAGLVYLAIWFTLPMNAWRVGLNLTVSDAGLLAICLLTPLLIANRRIVMNGRVLITGGLIVAGALAQLWLNPAEDASLLEVLPLTLSIGVPVLAVAVMRGIISERAIIWAYGLGGAVSALWMTFEEGLFDGRRLGLADHPNTAGVTLTLAAACLGALALTAESRRERGLSGIATVVVVVGAMSSGSRSVLVALGLMVAIGIVVLAKRPNGPALLTFAALPTSVFAYRFLADNPTIERLFAPDEFVGNSDSARSSRWSETVEAIGNSPIVGEGIEGIRNSHSLVPGLWAGVGILGFFAGLAVYTFLIARVVGIRNVRRHGETQISRIAAPAIAIALLIGFTFQTNSTDRFVWMFLAVVLQESAKPTPER